MHKPVRKDLLAGAAILLAIGVCPNARANAGTPLMWAGMLHLTIGNLVLGIAEGLAVSLIFKLRKLRAVGIMILANYCSAFVGGVFVRGHIIRTVDIHLDNAWAFLWLMVGVTFLLTLLLEYPFVLACFRGKSKRWRHSLYALLAVQAVSYLLLFGWYWGASGMSAVRDCELVPVAELKPPMDLLVYYISPRDGKVYRQPVLGEAAMAHEAGSGHQNDRLIAVRNETDPGSWDLVARLEPKDGGNKGTYLVLEKSRRGKVLLSEREACGTWRTFGKVKSVAGESAWQLHIGVWPIEGIAGTNRETGDKVYFAYETPFGAWTVRNAVILPNDQVLFQLGFDQICLLDPATKKVALVARGRGPLAVLEGSELRVQKRENTGGGPSADGDKEEAPIESDQSE